MTQNANNTQHEERNYSSLWFPKNETGAPQVMEVRVLHNDVSEFLQTTTHWVGFQKKGGGRGTIRVECAKQGTFGATRDQIYCPLDKLDKYPATTKQWFWVMDLTDGGLKYVEMPYSIRASLETLQVASFRGQPLMNFEVQIIKTGKGINTAYQVIPKSTEGVPFDLKGYLHSLGLEVLPPLVGTENFPPIWSLDEEGLENAAKGIMPWQKGGVVESGTPEQNTAAYNPYGNPAPMAQPAQQAQPAYTPQAAQPAQQSYAQPAQPAQPTYVQQGAPNLQTVQSDPLPASFGEQPINAFQEHIPNVPYGSNGVQEVEEEELEDTPKTTVFF